MFSTKTFLLYITTTAVLFSACSKTNESKLVDTSFGGTFLNQSRNGIGIPHLPVEVFWWDPNTSTKSVVGTGTTDASGKVQVPVKIDTTKFQAGYLLGFSCKLPSQFTSEFDNPQVEGISTRISRSLMQGINTFNIFERAPLAVQFRRTQNDNFQQLYIAAEAAGAGKVLYDNQMPTPGQLAFTIQTYANVKTYIRWYKFTPPLTAPAVVQVDSVVCLPNVSNTITINY